MPHFHRPSTLCKSTITFILYTLNVLFKGFTWVHGGLKLDSSCLLSGLEKAGNAGRGSFFDLQKKIAIQP